MGGSGALPLTAAVARVAASAVVPKSRGGSGAAGVRRLHGSTAAAAALPPHTRVAMPALSPTMTAGTIVKWHKKEGDPLNPGDLVAEVATDKATVDFECQDSGFLAKILVPDGTPDVPVGRLIAIMVDSKAAVADFASVTASELDGGGAPSAGAAAPAAAPAAPVAAPAPVAPVPAPAPSPAPSPASATAPAGGRTVASPLAKKLATDAGVPLGAVAGTGPGGRVIAADVRDFVAAGGLAAAAAAAAPAVAAAAAAVQPAIAAGVAAAGGRGAFTDVPHTAMRRVIAHRLTVSKQTVPHYTLTADVSLDALLVLRERLNAGLTTEGRLSVNDFLIKAAALSLRRVPEMNSSWLEHAIRAYDFVDVAVAVAVPDGLVTPIVKDADIKGLSSISRYVREVGGWGGATYYHTQ